MHIILHKSETVKNRTDWHYLIINTVNLQRTSQNVNTADFYLEQGQGYIIHAAQL